RRRRPQLTTTRGANHASTPWAAGLQTGGSLFDDPGFNPAKTRSVPKLFHVEHLHASGAPADTLARTTSRLNPRGAPAARLQPNCSTWNTRPCGAPARSPARTSARPRRGTIGSAPPARPPPSLHQPSQHGLENPAVAVVVDLHRRVDAAGRL